VSSNRKSGTDKAKSTRRATKRRDSDPVRTYSDGRLLYWTLGRPGAGERKGERHRTKEAADAAAVEHRLRLAQENGYGPHVSRTMDELAQDMLLGLRKAGAPQGTIRQYKSNWNTWIPDDLGAARCRSVSLQHHTALLDHLGDNGASEQTVKNVTRTLGAVVKWGHLRGYFTSAEPFGDAKLLEDNVKAARARARRARPRTPRPAGAVGVAAATDNLRHYPRQSCPTVEDVGKLAVAMEGIYPRYGSRLVYVAYGTGMRFLELLALRVPAVHLATCEIDVVDQLDRYNPWPAVVPPKGGKERTTIIWSCYADVMESLVVDALDRDPEDPHHGWLFPRHRSVKAWADRAGQLVGEARSNCEWPWRFHWLRHAFATQSLAPQSVGGYELDPVSVQHWLGHGRLSVTQDMYVERRSDDVEVAQQLTRNPPKRPVQ
jgi:integrase